MQIDINVHDKQGKLNKMLFSSLKPDETIYQPERKDSMLMNTEHDDRNPRVVIGSLPLSPRTKKSNFFLDVDQIQTPVKIHKKKLTLLEKGD